jgi:hypothetical protein
MLNHLEERERLSQQAENSKMHRQSLLEHLNLQAGLLLTNICTLINIFSLFEYLQATSPELFFKTRMTGRVLTKSFHNLAFTIPLG